MHGSRRRFNICVKHERILRLYNSKRVAVTLNDLFTATLKGQLFGVMTWAQWDQIQETLRKNNEPWYVYFVQSPPPQTPIAGSVFSDILAGIHALLRKEHRESYFGIAYVDNLQVPNLVKIYDPNHLGSSCGSSGTSTPPGWIISKWPPVAISGNVITPANRKRWWHSLIGN